MKVLTDNKYYGQIANVIREQNRTNNTYKPQQMVRALKDLFYEEVEGVPPITFQGIGENLLDYRIDGASGGVGERTKNLLQNTATSQTINGVTFTVNEDKSITCNGTAEQITQYVFSDNTIYENCVLSGCPSGGGYNNYLLRFRGTGGEQIAETGSGKPISNAEGYVEIRLNTGYTCDNLTFYPMIRLASIQDDTYEPYGYKVPVMVEGKNLLRNTATSQTINGVTFTVNSDKSVTVNGTATNSARLMLGAVELSAGEQYTMTGCPSGGSNNTYRLDPRRTNGSVLVSFIDTGNGSTYIPEADVKLNIYIYIQSGNILDNLTFYPMIRKADIEDDTYEPYHEPTTTNIYLDEPIGANESISLSDTNVNIPTIRGTNVLTVDTTVQPSNVYVKSRHESSYETAMRERYEEAQAQLDALESGGE